MRNEMHSWYIYTVYDSIFGDFPAKVIVYTPYMYPYILYIRFWPTLLNTVLSHALSTGTAIPPSPSVPVATARPPLSQKQTGIILHSIGLPLPLLLNGSKEVAPKQVGTTVQGTREQVCISPKISCNEKTCSLSLSLSLAVHIHVWIHVGLSLAKQAKCVLF